ncbi:spore coat associated protein CotJA [uncultured Clostridium sp.]|uniref:spore coat associated protein CotJA n=1 Tax=uncultured Clostridium sp. TaxID=59620 RepID=UPI0028E61520|nr:spore coat associated protein CotJA [uncultured Clostridium sp.]
MYKKDDCNFKLKKYARAFILPQPYENLFTCKEGFIKGTIFKDLYKHYDEKKKSKC